MRILRAIVEHALTKHDQVHVLMNEGNHDPAGSVWLRVMFTSALYANNPRVTVEMSTAADTCTCSGARPCSASIMATWSRNLGELPLCFAAKWPGGMGCHDEALHPQRAQAQRRGEVEHPGAKTIQHPTLAAEDAYAARHAGWLSERQATCMTYSKETGEYSRQIFLPEAA